MTGEESDSDSDEDLEGGVRHDLMMADEKVWFKMAIRQHAKKVVSESLGLVNFAIGLVNSVFNLPNGQVMFFEEFE